MAQMQFASFYLGESLFGLDVALVREINRNLEITPVNLAPAYVRGLLNLRGQIVTVIDLGVRLGIGERDITRGSKIIIMKTAEEMAAKDSENPMIKDAPRDIVGLLVDNIGDMITIDSSDIEPPPANVAGVDATFLVGVVKMEKGLLVVLNQKEMTALE